MLNMGQVRERRVVVDRNSRWMDRQRQIDVPTKHKLMNRFISRQTKRQIETQINRYTDRLT